ncbi:hypothetical protein B0I35DRAFT_446281 [Stachybotrys elegans]|uniref:BHLH domain-containing protein n=1 Tax=Stachybotrys elegans TaxID=80388 RepID=A0A8K0WJS3_9HYPO|nr:hypothetical protein B0I35DRAFT_446281 [Stachybotrys elegans]
MEFEDLYNTYPMPAAYCSSTGSPPDTPPLNPNGCHFFLPTGLLNEDPLIGAYSDVLLPGALDFAPATNGPAQPLASPIDVDLAGAGATFQEPELLDESSTLEGAMAKENVPGSGYIGVGEHLISPVSSRRNSVETNYTTSQTFATPADRDQAKPDLSPASTAATAGSLGNKLKRRGQRKGQARLPSMSPSNPKPKKGRSQSSGTQQDGALRMRHNTVEKKYRNRLNNLFDQLASILLEIAGKHVSAEEESQSKCHTLTKASILQMACRNLEDLIKAKQALQEEIHWLRSNFVTRGAVTTHQ